MYGKANVPSSDEWMNVPVEEEVPLLIRAATQRLTDDVAIAELRRTSEEKNTKNLTSQMFHVFIIHPSYIIEHNRKRLSDLICLHEK